MTNVSQLVEYFDQQAKSLLCEFHGKSKVAGARIRSVLSEENEIRIESTQHVIAVENEFGKWADLVEATPVQLQIAITLQKNPTLSRFGFGVSDHCGKSKQERTEFLAKYRLALRAHHHRVEATLDWLKTNAIAPSKSIYRGQGSYGMKHFVEKDIGYIANGDFITASIIAGFKFEINGSNAYFAMDEKSWRIAYVRRNNPQAFREGDSKSFFYYILCRRSTHSIAGDLTDDIRSNSNFPYVESWPQLEAYLRHMTGFYSQSAIIHAGRQLWQGYQAWLKKSANTH
ncbi:MAG TPA: hypothetical protein VE954_06920 [Oligoflexus sp.]|uniref:hypothetical protein n=1 Tax=Oligoflexus sp. TaxID=1971216 RepID=UPI002D5D7E07|nr:hypothetical protein [Oligoflexus sp.]HYX32829.1 hypothetical protein [Oligoflexus sp.]